MSELQTIAINGFSRPSQMAKMATEHPTSWRRTSATPSSKSILSGAETTTTVCPKEISLEDNNDPECGDRNDRKVIMCIIVSGVHMVHIVSWYKHICAYVYICIYIYVYIYDIWLYDIWLYDIYIWYMIIWYIYTCVCVYSLCFMVHSKVNPRIRHEHLHQLCGTDARGMPRRGHGKLLRHLILETKVGHWKSSCLISLIKV